MKFIVLLAVFPVSVGVAYAIQKAALKILLRYFCK